MTAETGEESHQFSMMDWSDDSYPILVSDRSDGHVHIPAHHVFAPFEPVPDFVREVLTEVYRKTKKTLY